MPVVVALLLLPEAAVVRRMDRASFKSLEAELRLVLLMVLIAVVLFRCGRTFSDELSSSEESEDLVCLIFPLPLALLLRRGLADRR